jgi:hypothetical protein
MRLAVLFPAAVLFTANLFASGPVGIYAIVEKVVLEPNERAPERIQVWGAFAFFDDEHQSVSAAKRGYMYFKLPAGAGPAETVRKEWADLKSVAGTGQAIAFGRWGYIGAFEGEKGDVRVRPETEPLNTPATYATNVGIVKLSAEGNHAETVKLLRESLKR